MNLAGTQYLAVQHILSTLVLNEHSFDLPYPSESKIGCLIQIVLKVHQVNHMESQLRFRSRSKVHVIMLIQWAQPFWFVVLFHRKNHKQYSSCLQPTSLCYDKVWLGATDFSTEGTFITTDGKTFNPTNVQTWLVSTTRPYKTLHCALNCLVASGGRVKDDVCDRKYPFICEKKLFADNVR